MKNPGCEMNPRRSSDDENVPDVFVGEHYIALCASEARQDSRSRVGSTPERCFWFSQLAFHPSSTIKPPTWLRGARCRLGDWDSLYDTTRRNVSRKSPRKAMDYRLDRKPYRQNHDGGSHAGLGRRMQMVDPTLSSKQAGYAPSSSSEPSSEPLNPTHCTLSENPVSVYSKMIEKVTLVAQKTVTGPVVVEMVDFIEKTRTLRVQLSSDAGVDDCEDVTNALLETDLDDNEIFLEVTTPGAKDQLLHDHEFSVFQSFPVTVTLKKPHKSLGSTIGGTLKGRDETHVLVNIKGRVVKFHREDVEEVRLVPARDGDALDV